MALVPREAPAATPHGPLREVLPGVHFVSGSVAMPMPLSPRIGRNMTVVAEGERLVLVNAVRLDDAGLAALDALGKVTDVIRIAGNHGMDDPFYRERHGAKVWALEGQRYVAGFGTGPDVYCEPDVVMNDKTELPIAGARLHVIRGEPPEALLVLERHGGTIVSGDCLQHWDEVDEHASFLGGMLLRLGGFVRPYAVGPAWLKQTKPPKVDLKSILDLEFENVLTAHGKAVIGGAREHYRAALERAASE